MNQVAEGAHAEKNDLRIFSAHFDTITYKRSKNTDVKYQAENSGVYKARK